MGKVLENFVANNRHNHDILRSGQNDLIESVEVIRSVKGAKPFITIGDILLNYLERLIQELIPQ